MDEANTDIVLLPKDNGDGTYSITYEARFNKDLQYATNLLASKRNVCREKMSSLRGNIPNKKIRQRKTNLIILNVINDNDDDDEIDEKDN